MPSIDAALKTYEVLEALHALPDKASLTTAEAALFLRLSPKTMERMRLDGSGPSYIQGGAVGAKGGNQKCFYLKEDLLAWQKANQISSSMEAAVRRGHAFMTIFDLNTEMAFYCDSTESICEPAEGVRMREAIERLGQWAIVWLLPVDAIDREWSNLVEQRNFAAAILNILDDLKGKINASLEAAEIAGAIREGGQEPDAEI